MSLLSFLLPNFDSSIIAAIVFGLIGAGIIWLSGFIPLKKFRNRVMMIGVFLIIGGILYWVGMSFIHDVFSNKKVLYSMIAGASVIVVGSIIFIPDMITSKVKSTKLKKRK